ncbi:MAG TPA: hypothetical protein VFG12_14805, partial [Rhodopila sp.]|nr:hypothetical protein [Rhodopila sp.]
MDSHTEHFADLKGNSVPRGPALEDEGDEIKVWSGGGTRVGETFQLSKGAAQEARDEVAASANSGAKFFEDNVRSEKNPTGKLTAEHFGVDGRWGYGQVEVSPEHRAEIEKVMTEWASQHGRHDFGFQDVERAAIAQYQYRRDIDYVVAEVVMDGHPQKLVLLIDRVNGEVRHDPETNNDVRVSNGIHRALEAKEHLVEEASGLSGLKIRHDVDAPKKMTSQEYYLKRIAPVEINGVEYSGDKISTISGTNIESSELMAENYEKLGPTIAIDRFNQSNVDFDPDLMFDTQEQKRAWMVEEIRRLQEKGQRVLVGADRNDKPAALSKLLTEQGIPHRVIGDAAYQLKHGAGWQDQVEVDIKEALKNNEAILGGPTLGRGTDFRVPDEAMDRGGIYLLADGRSGITDVVDAQLQNRVGRNGDPGRYRFLLSRDDDTFTQIKDSRMQVAITHYEGAAKAHADAQADPSRWKPADLDTLKQARDAEAARVLNLIPQIQQDAQQHLFTSHAFATHPAPAAQTPAAAPKEGKLNLPPPQRTRAAATATGGATGAEVKLNLSPQQPTPAAATGTNGATGTQPAPAEGAEGPGTTGARGTATSDGVTGTGGMPAAGGAASAVGTGDADGTGEADAAGGADVIAGVDDTTGTDDAAGTDDTSKEPPVESPSAIDQPTTIPDATRWASTPLAGAIWALAFARDHFGSTTRFAEPKTKPVTAAQFVNHVHGHVGSHAKPAGPGWADNPDVAGLIKSLGDPNDMTAELVFLATSSAGSEQQDRVWVLIAEGGKVLLVDQGGEEKEISSAEDLREAGVDLDASLRAIVVDAAGNVQTPTAHATAVGSRPTSVALPVSETPPSGPAAAVAARAHTPRGGPPSQSEVAGAAPWLQWLVMAVDAGRRSGETAPVDDPAVDVMEVAAVAE